MMSRGDQNNDHDSHEDDWSDFDFSTVRSERDSLVQSIGRANVLKIIFTGLIGGMFVWLLRLAIQNWVMSPVFCRTYDTATICANADITSFIIALIIVGLITLAILLRNRTYQPTLTAVATFVSFFALWEILEQQNVAVAIVASAFLTMLLLLIISLLATIRKMFVSIVMIAIFVLMFWFIVSI